MMGSKQFDQSRSGFLNFPALLVFLGMGLCAIFFGLLAVTANPVMISLGVGLIGGVILLFMPRVTVWLVLGLGLVMGVLSLIPGLDKLPWMVSMLSLLLLVPAAANLFEHRRHKLPAFVWIALLFLACSLLVTLLRWYSFGEFIAGFKRYFQMYGLMLALATLAFTPKDFVRWRKLMLGVALLQFPFALYQLLVLVPQRGGLALSSYTTDVVAGTFGANMHGGSPGIVMVIFLFVVIAFLTARWRAGLIASKYFLPLAMVCLLPIGLGETKVAVIMLPLVGLVLLRNDIARAPMRYLPAAFMLALLAAVLGYLYVAVMMDSSLEEAFASTIRYNFGDQGYSQSQILNRFTSLTFWWSRQGLDDPVGLLLGNGLGSSYTALNALAGHVGVRYLGYGINLTAASTLLWDTGLFGLLLFIGIFSSAWAAANRLRRQAADPAVQADALAIQAAIALFLISVVYSDVIVNLPMMEVIYAAVLGYLAYLLREHGDPVGTGAIGGHRG